MHQIDSPAASGTIRVARGEYTSDAIQADKSMIRTKSGAVTQRLRISQVDPADRWLPLGRSIPPFGVRTAITLDPGPAELDAPMPDPARVLVDAGLVEAGDVEARSRRPLSEVSELAGEVFDKHAPARRRPLPRPEAAVRVICALV